MKEKGILLHISSLPGEYGCGSLGAIAYELADVLQKQGFSYWQVLPLNLTHADGSPYSSPCSYLQNPLFIDPDILQQKGLLKAAETAELKANIPPNGLSFEALYRTREPYLHLAAARAWQLPRGEEISAYLHGHPHVWEGCRHLARDDEQESRYLAFLQHEFHVQWQALRHYLHAHGIRVIGDLPFYPDLHSSEVQRHQENFLLDRDGTPLFESGVPGDDFSDEGQHWGHPLYNNDALCAQHYAPLLERFLHAASLYDEIRIDHFQALLRFYAIPRGHPVREGHWKPGLGESFLHALLQRLSHTRLIAEDLGCFQPESRALARKFAIPPMNVLQFALLGGGSAADFEPHSVAYTGTHDCDTLVGFFTALTPDLRAALAWRLGEGRNACAITLARAAMRHLMQCPAERILFPAQDLLLLDGNARMNLPGTTGTNWRWRLTWEDMDKLKDSPPL